MLPNFLVPESDYQADGASEAVELGDSKGKLIRVTLDVTRIIEQESLDVSIWASADGEDWGTTPIASFPQKLYCGTYVIQVDLSRHPEAAYLMEKWKMSRWGRGAPKPLFGFYVYAEESSEVSAVARA